MAKLALTIGCHAEQPLVVIRMWMNRWPSGNVDLLSQTNCVIFEQRLHVFPASKRADTAHSLDILYIIEARAASVPVHGTLLVGRLELAALHDNAAGCGDGALCDVKGVVIVF